MQHASSLVSWDDPWARWRARTAVLRRGATSTKAAAAGVQNLARRLAVVAAPCAVAGSPAMVAIMAIRGSRWTDVEGALARAGRRRGRVARVGGTAARAASSAIVQKNRELVAGDAPNRSDRWRSAILDGVAEVSARGRGHRGRCSAAAGKWARMVRPKMPVPG